tara:strand:+ start:105 stop:317 length:213 start_codon:yes stop_codon:yes gene_type:complete
MNEEISILVIIFISLVVGFILGAISLILLIKDNTNELKREIKTLKRKLTDCLIAYDKATSYEDDPDYNAY